MSERLGDNTVVSLIMRLLVSKEGEIMSGEVGTVSSTEQHQHWLRFRDSAGLVDVVASLARAAVSGKPPDTG